MRAKIVFAALLLLSSIKGTSQYFNNFIPNYNSNWDNTQTITKNALNEIIFLSVNLNSTTYPRDFELVKLDRAGNYLLSKRVLDSIGTLRAISIIPTYDTGYIVTGVYQGAQPIGYPRYYGSLHTRKNERTSIAKNIKTAERASYKNGLLELLETNYSKSRSTQHFLELIQEHGHEPYYRNGKLQGVRYNGELKFRFSRLGFDEKKLNELDTKREKHNREIEELRSIRNKGRELGANSLRNESEKSDNTTEINDPVKSEACELQEIRERGSSSLELDQNEFGLQSDEDLADNINFKSS